MRSASVLLVLSVFLLITACGGSVAPSPEKSSGGPSTDPTGTGSSGSDGTKPPSGNSSGGGVRCTAHAYVFCRCADRSEGTKVCYDDGQSFGPCECGDR
jgi:hypothetical protein